MGKLNAYANLSGKNDRELAEMFGVSRPHVAMIRAGRAYPSRKLMARIQEVTHGLVPISAWFDS